MAVYYRFKSSKEEDSIQIDGPFIALSILKENIMKSKKLAERNVDIVIINPLTNEEFDETTLIARCSRVLVRRVPRRYLLPIVIPPEEAESKLGCKSSVDLPTEETSSVVTYPEDLEWDEFVQNWSPKSETQSRLENHDVAPGGGVGAGSGGRRILEERVFLKTPPQGYVCRRCMVPGHFIQNCPTNSDRDYDIKWFKRPTGIPKSMLTASTDGSYVLPGGNIADLKPNDAVFEEEIAGLPSKKLCLDHLPQELHCPLCKKVMKYAVFTSSCCFNSFCDECIRDHIITKSMCVCGETNVLTDSLIPNKTVRNTIDRLLESDYSNSSGKTTSSQKNSEVIQYPEESHVPSAPPKRKLLSPPIQTEETSNVHGSVEQGEPELKKMGLSAKEVEQKSVSAVGPKKKRKKNADADVDQWRSAQNIPAQNHMIYPASYNPYGYNQYFWTGMNPYAFPYSSGF